MGNIFYRPKNAWFGDAIPFYDKGIFYIYYLYDERKTTFTADHTSWHLVSTRDFVHWKEEGEVLPAGSEKDIDQACYTGSVIKGNDGVYHLFYTGQNPLNQDYELEGKPQQYILHAVSTDLINWEKHYETAFPAQKDKFEPHDWRDPFVFYQEETGEYYMLLAARLQGKSFRRSGCVAICRSKDLWNWQPGEIFSHLECIILMNVPICFVRGNGGIYFIQRLQHVLQHTTEKQKVFRGLGNSLMMMYWTPEGFMLLKLLLMANIVMVLGGFQRDMKIVIKIIWNGEAHWQFTKYINLKMGI